MFKFILVHLRGTKGDSAALAAALQVAQPFAGHLDCLHIRANFGPSPPNAAPVEVNEDANEIVKLFETLKRQDAEAAQRASNALAAFTAKEGVLRAESPPGSGKVSAAFREGIGNEVDELVAQGRYHDLVVVKGGGEDGGGLSSFDLGRLIISIGRPVLLAPSAPARRIRTAVIAWKEAPEAARAMTAAMPLLTSAENIFVINASEADERACDCKRVVQLLSWHGLKAASHHVVPGQRGPGDAVLETARAANADLLVMGAYGRRRLSELILGGFTRSVLDDASLPVLLFH